MSQNAEASSRVKEMRLRQRPPADSSVPLVFLNGNWQPIGMDKIVKIYSTLENILEIKDLKEKVQLLFDLNECVGLGTYARRIPNQIWANFKKAVEVSEFPILCEGYVATDGALSEIRVKLTMLSTWKDLLGTLESMFSYIRDNDKSRPKHPACIRWIGSVYVHFQNILNHQIAAFECEMKSNVAEEYQTECREVIGRVIYNSLITIHPTLCRLAYQLSEARFLLGDETVSFLQKETNSFIQIISKSQCELLKMDTNTISQQRSMRRSWSHPYDDEDEYDAPRTPPRYDHTVYNDNISQMGNGFHIPKIHEQTTSPHFNNLKQFSYVRPNTQFQKFNKVNTSSFRISDNEFQIDVVENADSKEKPLTTDDPVATAANAEYALASIGDLL